MGSPAKENPAMCPVAAELVEPANFDRHPRDSGYKSTAFDRGAGG